MVRKKQDVLDRAIVYFTIWELFGSKSSLVRDIWARIKLANKGISEGLLFSKQSPLSDLRINLQEFRKIKQKVAKSFQSLPLDASVIEMGGQEYPGLLAKTPDAPEFLFVRGNLDLFSRPALSVVGTRKPSEEGRRRAYKLGYLLAKRGFVVVSGLARGIDEAAHRGALAIGGDTIAVLGTPLTQVYPKEHLELQETIGQAGLLVSQFYPGAKVQRYYFPLRNAVMSGLTLGTIVVEASETSGALIQARKCLQHGRRLFIPKSAVENPLLKWPESYLARGAKCFNTIEELLKEAGGPSSWSKTVLLQKQSLCL